MPSPQPRTGHSAIVRPSLRIGPHTLHVSQMGPDFIILREPFSSPPCQAIATVEVDGISDTFPVDLPHGISSYSRQVVIAKVGSKS